MWVCIWVYSCVHISYICVCTERQTDVERTEKEFTKQNSHFSVTSISPKLPQNEMIFFLDIGNKFVRLCATCTAWPDLDLHLYEERSHCCQRERFVKSNHTKSNVKGKLSLWFLIRTFYFKRKKIVLFQLSYEWKV